MIKITLLMLLIAAYIYIRAVHPLRCSRWVKAGICLVLLVPALRYVILKQCGGFALAPDAPPWLLYGTAIPFIAFLMYFCGVLGGHTLRLLALPRVPAWRRLTPEAQQGIFHRFHLALLPVTLTLSACGLYSGLSAPELKQVQLPFPTAEPLRIALISDLHVSATRSPDFVRDIVRRINAQKPDIVALVGDFMDGLPETCGAQLEPLSELCAPLGVYGVSGNHDYYSGYTRWRPELSSLGIRMLDNEHITLPSPHKLVLAGVTDESASFEKMEETDLTKALHGAPEELPILLLAHRPIVAREAAPLGVQLQLSGHLHGGLVWGAGLLIAALDAGYRAGLYQVGDMQLYVSAGAGCSARTPLRLGVPAEITIIDLIPTTPAKRKNAEQ